MTINNIRSSILGIETKQGIEMALKQVQLKPKANEQLEAICKLRTDNELLGDKKKDAVADAIALLFKKECK